MTRITVQPSEHSLPALAACDDLAAGVVHLPSMTDIKRKLTTKEGWIGGYDFRFLCMPQLPWGNNKRRLAPPFYGLNDPLPISLALVLGFQHSLAMLAGIITPPIILASQLGMAGNPQTQMVAVSLIASGILSAIQMTRFKIPFTNKYMGTGLITVVGTSFATLSTASSIFNILYSDGTCPTKLVDGVITRLACPAAYGYYLGTAALCSLLEIGLAFVPARILKRIFPPIVTGTVILLIGATLIGSSGFLAWGGGSNACKTRPTSGIFALCPTIFAPHALKWGDPRYIGLGFLSFFSIILLEFIGSPAMRSSSIVLGLLVGMIVAGPLGYVDPTSINTAPAVTFLWTQTYPLRVHGPSILPMMASYIALAMEATGDVTASSEASREPVQGPLFDSRVQGGVLADGVNGMLSALMMNPPVSIYAQNNGVIAITRCANRTAGYYCASFLIFFGVFAKISGVFLAIPNSVLGGVTTFLFASVMVSGAKVIAMNAFTRRDRIVLTAAFSLGVGNLLIPTWSSYIFTNGTNSGLNGFYNSLIIILDTPFLIAGLMATVLNLLLPEENDTIFESELESLEAVNEDVK